MFNTTNVKNVPNYAYEYKFWVCTLYNHELWFFGAWNDRDKAYDYAKENGKDKVVLEYDN